MRAFVVRPVGALFVLRVRAFVAGLVRTLVFARFRALVTLVLDRHFGPGVPRVPRLGRRIGLGPGGDVGERRL
jgi:hypothetical protein